MTATLAVAAHATAGGGLPSGAATILLALVAATVGVLVTTLDGAARVEVLFALLALGQLLGHAVLGAGGHSHAAATAPWALMIAAHAVAVLVGATLIAAGGHLCAAVSHALHTTAAPPRRPVASVSAVAVGGADQPLLSALLVATSMSYRGPPVSLAR